MRSHRNENGHTLLVVPREMIGPFRNALQKLAGGIDFFALDAAERDCLDQALRHLWNPGDDAQGREKTVPIDVLAVTLRDQATTANEPADALESPTIRKPGPALARLTARAPTPGSPPAPSTNQPTLEDARPTVELAKPDLTAAVELPERPSRQDGYRAPTKGRHPDVAR